MYTNFFYSNIFPYLQTCQEKKYFFLLNKFLHLETRCPPRSRRGFHRLGSCFSGWPSSFPSASQRALWLDLARSPRTFKMLVRNTARPHRVTPKLPSCSFAWLLSVLLNPCCFFTSWSALQTSMKYYSIREYFLIFSKYPCIIWEGRHIFVL